MKLDKKILRRIIVEEFEKIKAEKNIALFESKKPKLKRVREKLIKKGYSPQRVDEQLFSALSGVGSRILGLGGSEYFSPGESESVFGGLSGGIRTALEQSALEMVVKKLGLDPYTGFGLILKNALEQVIRNYSTGELQSLFSGGSDCKELAFNISKEVLVILEESSKERVLKFALDAIGGELGEDFMSSPIFKPVYQNMREKFSEAFESIINEDSLAQSLADVLCETLNMSNMVDSAQDYLGDAADTAIGEFANVISSIAG